MLRSRAIFNAMRAAYPDERVEWRRVWGAYVAAVGLKNVVPAGGANVVQIFLTKSSIERSTFPTVTSAITVGAIFDAVVSVLTMIFAFTQGVFPKPPDFAKLNAFDLEYFASHPHFTLFLLTALAVLIVLAFALLSLRVKAFWLRVRQGFTILRDRRRYVREVASWQAASWACRLTAWRPRTPPQSCWILRPATRWWRPPRLRLPAASRSPRRPFHRGKGAGT